MSLKDDFDMIDEDDDMTVDDERALAALFSLFLAEPDEIDDCIQQALAQHKWVAPYDDIIH